VLSARFRWVGVPDELGYLWQPFVGKGQRSPAGFGQRPDTEFALYQRSNHHRKFIALGSGSLSGTLLPMRDQDPTLQLDADGEEP